ncbi:MAG: hypothetical protein LBI95_03095 [Holosporales bacterium]|jgi:hypothetical protein|nr:hypothetical protein [Holosporales bacterium]
MARDAADGCLTALDRLMMKKIVEKVIIDDTRVIPIPVELFVMIVTGTNVYATSDFQTGKGNDNNIFEQMNRGVLTIKRHLETFQQKTNSLNQEIESLTLALKRKDLEIEKVNDLKSGVLEHRAQLVKIAEDLQAIGKTE